MMPAKTLNNSGEGAFSNNHIDDYFSCHHRTIIQQLMEVDAEIHSYARSQAFSDHSKKGKSDNTSKGVKTMTWIPTKATVMSQSELTDSGLRAGESA